MNILIFINDRDVTDSCKIADTRIAYDSTKRLTTASITVMGESFGRAARYDYAHYDENRYAIDISELYNVRIVDGRDGVTKLFEGQILSFEMEQTDSEPGVYYKCELNDHAALLDRAVCWDASFPVTMPASDKQIIQTLLGHFCPGITVTDVAEIVPVIMNFDWKTKTCRQVLDDIAALSMGEWRVDFDAQLHYKPASAAPPAPFDLSTSPDFVDSFPVKVSGYRRDFSNPINRAFLRGGADPATGVAVEASYADPVSIATYGEYASAAVDDQITTAWDAALRVKSTVLRYAFPVEQGNFTIWKDGLECGMQVSIHEDNLNIDGWYVIRALALAWEDKETVRYEAQFGAAQPDLETLLRQLEQRARWKTSNPVTGIPAPGSVTDASIATGGLHAGSIATVNAGAITGLISAGQIGSVNAGVIAGAIVAEQIGSVNAPTIQGAILAGQIGSVNATVIQGVVVSSQLADKIISDLSKFADALVPIRMVTSTSAIPTLPNKDYPPNSFFYNQADGHFYRINPAGTGWAVNDNPQGALPSFYHIGAISANSIVGLIVAAQIQSITAGQITGAITASQIGSVNASAITGSITAGQISTVNASAIQGTITSTQIGSVSAGSITGTISSGQIGSVAAATITIGLIGSTQIGSVDGGTINAGSVNSSKLNTTSIDCGGIASVPGRIRVYNGSSTLVGQIGNLDTGGFYGGWFQVFGAGGTYYGDAKVKSDTAGNVTITNANLSISGSGCTLSTGPSTFDTGGGYTSLTLNMADATDRAAHITRGMVIYYNGTKVGAFNRSPSATAGELTLMNTSGGGYIFLDGNTGRIRADAGFQVGSNQGWTANVDCAGVHLKFVSGIYCGTW